jgi:hypothetical protein
MGIYKYSLSSLAYSESLGRVFVHAYVEISLPVSLVHYNT